MTKIVYNNCYGGFGLSEAGMLRYAEIKGIKLFPKTDPQFKSLRMTTYWTVPPEGRVKILPDGQWHSATQEERIASNQAWSKLSISDRDIPRDDAALVQVVEELGERANGQFASLAIAEVPKGARYRVDEYDGNESVMTTDDYDWSIA